MRTAYIESIYGRETHGRPIDRIVYHGMAEFVRDKDGQVYYCIDWLKHEKISAHALITPSAVIIRTRRDEQVAWHAKGFNFGSLGIEFLVPGIHDYNTFLQRIDDPYLTDGQLRAGIDMTREWTAKHQIKHIDAHSDLTSTKYDPGRGFPREEYLKGVGYAPG